MLTKTADIITALVLLLFGLIVAVDSIDKGIGWAAEGPRAGFFPFVMAVLILGGCFLVIRQAIKGTSSVKGAKRFVEAGGMKPILIVIVPAVLMILLTEVIGLYLASILYLTFYIKWAGGHSWRTSLLIGIPVPLVSYIIFDKFFLIPMPMGWYGAQILRF
jgi:putative tricarboxylic transport membrane protein